MKLRIIFLSLLLMTYSIQSSTLEKVSLQLNWKFQFEFAGFMIAKEKGFYRDVGIDLELKEYEDGIHISDEVLNNQSHFGVSDTTIVLNAIQGKPIVGLMATFQHSPFVLLGLKSSGIKTLQDLNNKSLSLFAEIDGITILSMLKSNHIKYQPYPKVFDLSKLISKEVDMISAYATNEVFVAQEQGLDIITFDPKDYGFDSYANILFTSKETIKKHPEMVRNFYNATKKGWKYAFENIDEVVEFIFNNYNTLGKSKKALLFEANTLKEMSEYDKNFGNLDLGKLKSISNLYTFLISGKYDISNLNNFIYKEEDTNILLTKDEIEYLKNVIEESKKPKK